MNSAPGVKLFRPYDPDVGSGRTSKKTYDKTTISFHPNHHLQHKLFGYAPVLNPRDGQCYLQPLPTSYRLLDHTSRFSSQVSYVSGMNPGLISLSSTPTLPVSPLMLPIPQLNGFMSGGPSKTMGLDPMGFLKSATPILPVTPTSNKKSSGQKNDSPSSGYASRDSDNDNSSSSDSYDVGLINVCD